MTLIETLLTRHEGLKLKPYTDTKGKLTIGIGRNLDDVGISEREAYNLLRADIFKADNSLRNTFPWYANIDENRRAVLTSMVFNMGMGGFNQFQNMISSLASGNYEKAADDMLDSEWAKEVKGRAIELSLIMKTGQPG